MIKCIIIEDQPPAQRILQKFIADVDGLSCEAVFSDAMQAMNYINSHQVDLMFLDIHLPKLSGIEFLRSVPNHPKVILTTAFANYALESYEYNVVDYLLKPFSFQRFVKAVSKVTSSKDKQEEDVSSSKSIFVKAGYEQIRVGTDQIIYIKSDTDYTEVVTDSSKHITNLSLKEWLSQLNEKQFAQVHKSYIVSINHIEKIYGGNVYLRPDYIIPVGRVYKDAFKEKYQVS